MLQSKRLFLSTVSALAVGVGVFASFQMTNAGAAAPEGAPPAPPAQVMVLQPEKVALWKNFTGRLQAVDYVEIRPEVSGKIVEVRFRDGQLVNKGDVLFVIDPAPYQAALDKGKADYEVAKNQFALSQKDLARAQDLVKTEAISKKIFDERSSAATVANSQMQAAQAQMKQAQIDLDRAYVKAPISGRVSRAEITEGNLIQAAAAPVLTTIVSDKGIYADFDVDERTYLNDIYPSARGLDEQAKIPVEMVLKSGTGATYKGTIESFDNRIDPKSGTIRVRALFENSDQALLPGMFANVRLGSLETKPNILVPENAIGTDQDRKFVYVVGDGNKVIYREVKLGDSINGQRIITSGLKPGEKVITEGIMKIRPEMVVAPQTAKAPAPQETEPSAE
jgi:multidrug efflux system membrane fusion protein